MIVNSHAIRVLREGSQYKVFYAQIMHIIHLERKLPLSIPTAGGRGGHSEKMAGFGEGFAPTYLQGGPAVLKRLLRSTMMAEKTRSQ